MRAFSTRELSRVTHQLKKTPTTSSTIMFRNAGLQKISKSTRCRVLRRLAKHVKPEVLPPLKDIHKIKHIAWAQKYLKWDFQHVLFTDECRATLDGSDAWSKIWVPNWALRPHRLRLQQGSRGVMFWACIIGNELVGPIHVQDGVKLTAVANIDFLKQNVLPWFKKKQLSFKNKMVFMHDNEPYHPAKLTSDFLATVGFK